MALPQAKTIVKRILGLIYLLCEAKWELNQLELLATCHAEGGGFPQLFNVN